MTARCSGVIRAAALAGLVVPLAGCVAAPGSGAEAAEQRPSPGDGAVSCPETRGWTAWVNAMPGPDKVPTLIVEGEVNLPEGTVAVLEPATPDSGVPPVQRFVLHPGAATGEGRDRAGIWRKVRAKVRPAQDTYGAIVIRCGGQTIAELTEMTRAY